MSAYDAVYQIEESIRELRREIENAPEPEFVTRDELARWEGVANRLHRVCEQLEVRMFHIETHMTSLSQGFGRAIEAMDKKKLDKKKPVPKRKAKP